MFRNMANGSKIHIVKHPLNKLLKIMKQREVTS